MTKCTTTLVGLLLLVSTGFASDPGSARLSNKYAPTKRVSPNPYLKAAADLDVRDRMMARNASEFVGLIALPQPRIAEFVDRVLSAKERDEFSRFWMNNQPSVLSYNRLKGAIGP